MNLLSVGLRNKPERVLADPIRILRRNDVHDRELLAYFGESL